MWKFQKPICAVVVYLALCLAWPAQAGPNFVEGMCNGEAGSDPSSACRVTGGGGGLVMSISGKINGGGGGLGPPDFEDMYVILITDPKGFSATTTGADTGFDTQLWLFRVDELDPTSDGLGLLANDDSSAADDASMMGSMSDDGTGIAITMQGLYYLAVSGGAGLGDPGDGRFPVAGGVPIFALISPTEISGPDGPGGMSVVDDWAGEGEVGSYTIALEGVTFLEPLCPWDCEMVADGGVGITDFLALLGAWAVVGASCDFDGGGVGITDFLDLLAHWGPCP